MRDFFNENPQSMALIIILGSIILAFSATKLSGLILHRWARNTRTDLDDKLIGALRMPISLSIILAGLAYSLSYLQLEPVIHSFLFRLFKSIAIVIWMFAGYGLSTSLVFLGTAERSFLKPRIQPLISMVVKSLVIGLGIYFLFRAWGSDVSVWLTGAGIVGIAVGFAAKDTLANLFSGVFILADAPYKLGDYIVLDGEIRGVVTHIGLRSTRILTRDDVEVIVPNSVIGNAKIINESGGPHESFRVRVAVSISYESDIDQVRQILLDVARAQELVELEPEARVRFRRFGDSGLDFELLVWVAKPEFRGKVLDLINCAIFKAFKAANVEIPYPKRDVYLYNRSE